MKLKFNIKGAYFIGIGGIGMSAIARYFRYFGVPVAGYDRTESPITMALENEGCQISFDETEAGIPALFSDATLKDRLIIVYTPAIPSDNKIMNWFRQKGFILYKRSEILGEISATTSTLAVSGTHGKTTVSTMLAHIMYMSQKGCSAFLGGISKNYESNLILSESRFTVMEADEYDRSFHRLQPEMAVVTAMDPDHLEIYGDHESMIKGYNIFFSKIRKGGYLLMNEKVRNLVVLPPDVKGYTYGVNTDSDFRATNVRQEGEKYLFDLSSPSAEIKDIVFPFPGKINVENAVAASSMALLCGVSAEEIRKALETFTGVRRRFDVRINRPGLTYIDDYAHHPEEIKACINSVREYYGTRKITGIFQPHLFTRTKDHAAGFAEILDTLDEAILLPIYPAREKPLEGVTSGLIFGKMKSTRKRLLNKEEIPAALDIDNIDVLLTIGAGDIDRLVKPIEDELNRRRG